MRSSGRALTRNASASVVTIVAITITPCTRAIDSMSRSSLGASSSPAWGPDPVTSVPATIAAAVPATTHHTSCMDRRETCTGDLRR